jgi:glycosyltransferase involved in cell wall biosynthesis
MKLRKVIHIYNRAYNDYFPDMESDYYYLAGWSGTVAKQTVKYTNEYVIENWRPERDIKRPVVRRIEGVVCRLFPSHYSTQLGELSTAMIREMLFQTKKCDVLIHHSSVHNNSLRLVSLFFKRNPIVAQQHGDSPAFFKYIRNRRLKKYITHSVEKSLLRNVDHFFVLRNAEADFLNRISPKSTISLQTMGVDFSKFFPANKKASRKKLGIQNKKKVMLYVGRFYRLKGVDLILKAFCELRREYCMELVLVGGKQTDELYYEAKKSGAMVFGRVPHDEITLFYNAADVYMLPGFSPSYWGIDVATMESLACGTPIVSTTLKEIPAADRKNLGIVPKDELDIARCVSEVLEYPERYRNCRSVAMKYYCWRNIIKQTVCIYDRLFDDYYS